MLSYRRNATPFIAGMVLASCGGGDVGTGPDAGQIATVIVWPTSVTLEVGKVRQLNATVRNAAGQTVTTTLEWTASPGAIVAVEQSGSVVALAPGTTTVTATAGGRSGSASVTVLEPTPPAAPGIVTAFPVSDVEIGLFWSDRSENETGFRIERAELGPTTADIEADPEADLEAELRAELRADLDSEFAELATVDADETTFRDADALPATGYSYRVSACNAIGCTPGDTQPQSSTFETLKVSTPALPAGRVGDAYHHQFTAAGGDGTFLWSLASGSLPDGMGLEGTGRLSGTPLSGGIFGIEVLVQGGGQAVSKDFSLDIEGAFLIVAPEVPVGRLGVPYAHELGIVGGTPPFAWSVSAGPLPDGIALDASDGSLYGVPGTVQVRPLTIRVDDALGEVTERSFEFRTCDAPLALAPGQSVTVGFPDACGIALDGSVADYRAAFVARSPDSGPSEVAGGLRLLLRSGQPGVEYPVSPALGIPPALAPDEGLDPAIRALAEATERLHLQLREEEYRSNLTNPDPPPLLGPPLQALGLPTPQPVDPPVTRTFWISEPGAGRGEHSATLRGFNASVEYYEDDGVGAAGTRATDREVQDIIDYYHTYGTPIIENVFGGLGPPGTTMNFRDGPTGPVLTLPANDIDGNGRLIILQIRPALMPSGAAAYVSSCDRRPRPGNNNPAATESVCTGSNQAEIAYLARPNSGFYLGTSVHEAKHVSSHGYAVFAGRGFNASWIEEGTAEIAKEKSSRDAAGVADGVELGYADIYDGSAATYGMRTVTSRSRSFLRASPLSALIGNPSPNPNGSTYYGAGWLFHRFLADNYAGGDEDSFFHSLNTIDDDIGRIEQVVGKPFETLFAEFVTAIALEGEPEARAAAARAFVSYDHAGIAGPFTGDWPYVQASLPFQSTFYSVPISYHTAPNFVAISSLGGPTLRLDAETADGDPVVSGSDVALVVVRIR